MLRFILQHRLLRKNEQNSGPSNKNGYTAVRMYILALEIVATEHHQTFWNCSTTVEVAGGGSGTLHHAVGQVRPASRIRVELVQVVQIN